MRVEGPLVELHLQAQQQRDSAGLGENLKEDSFHSNLNPQDLSGGKISRQTLEIIMAMIASMAAF